MRVAAVLALPAPEPLHKAAAITGIASLLAADITTTTAIQMQLALDLSLLYECPFYKNDEEDIWEIFKLAIGLKGKEKVGSKVQFVFKEGAKKNFRKLLRNKQLRKRMQDWVLKRFGKEIAKLLSEKYLLRLIPLANIGIATFFNNRVTKAVGKYSKIKSKIRSSCFKNIDQVKSNSSNSKWILPIIFYAGTANDSITTNFISLYSQSLKRIGLTEEQEDEVTKIIDDDNISDSLEQFCSNCNEIEVRKLLLDIAITTVAINLKATKEDEKILIELSEWFRIDYSKTMLNKKIKYLKK